MRQPLYNIAQEYLEAYDVLHGLEDMPDEAINNTLEGLKGCIEEKAINIAAIIKNMEADANEIKKAEAIMYERRKKIESTSEKLNKYLLTNLRSVGLSRLFTPEIEVEVKVNPTKVVIDVGTTLHEDYMRIKQIKEPDKIKLKEAISNGLHINGVRLEQNYRLVIK